MFRCPWCESDPLLQRYHDTEWGKRPCPEVRHFEFLMLECAQAGLSWMAVLKRREAYREAFGLFDAAAVAGYGEAHIKALLENQGIIRNRQKIIAAIQNARAFLNVQADFGTFDAYLLSFFGGRPLVNAVADDKLVPTATAVSQRISADMKSRGFSFLGATVLYSHLQAAGIVDDHVDGCFCKAALSPPAPDAEKFAALARIGKAFRNAGILFGVGGSCLLYRHGLSGDFNDIDLLVAEKDGARADALLSGLGRKRTAKSSDLFATERFNSFIVDGIGVDMMAGLTIRCQEGLYRHPFDESSVNDFWPVNGVMLPFCALEDWCVLYHLMPGKTEKAQRICSHLLTHGVRHPMLLKRAAAHVPGSALVRLYPILQKYAGMEGSS